jgi:2-dehydro-3-deoxyphosphogluconate aldolase/(4S)-4-hydroxy-2-oxoglutarate aldolase
MRTIEQIFGQKKIVPTVSLESQEIIEPVCNALLNGGINVIAVRLLSAKSLAAVEYINSKLPDITVGVAGIMDAAGFLNASIAGAKFISSPGITPELFTAARTRYNDAHFLPGMLMPSHIMDALSRGFEVMNLFPAEVLNGYELLKTYAHTFPKAKFAVNGGINFENMEKYLALDNVVAVGLSSIADSKLIAAKNYSEMTELAKKAVKLSDIVMQNKLR